MPLVAEHLSVTALAERLGDRTDAVEARHVQVIWLLARGHTVRDVASMTTFGERWVQQLLERYNAHGPEALADRRLKNGAKARVLTAEVLDALRVRLAEPPPDGGLWTSGKVAAFMAERLGLETVAAQRGWDALKAIGWSLQKPRPRNPRSASGAEAEAFKKSSATRWPRNKPPTPAPRSRCGPPTSTASA